MRQNYQPHPTTNSAWIQILTSKPRLYWGLIPTKNCGRHHRHQRRTIVILISIVFPWSKQCHNVITSQCHNAIMSPCHTYIYILYIYTPGSSVWVTSTRAQWEPCTAPWMGAFRCQNAGHHKLFWIMEPATGIWAMDRGLRVSRFLGHRHSEADLT